MTASLWVPHSGHVCCFCCGIKFMSVAHCLDSSCSLRPDTFGRSSASKTCFITSCHGKENHRCGLHNSQSTALASRLQDVSGRTRTVFAAAGQLPWRQLLSKTSLEAGVSISPVVIRQGSNHGAATCLANHCVDPAA